MAKKIKKARSAAAARANGAAVLETPPSAHQRIDPAVQSPAPSRPTERAPQPNKLVWTIGIGLVALVALVFFRVPAFQFVTLDDPYAVFQNGHVNRGLTIEGIRWAFTDIHLYYWQPLTYLSHMLVCQLFGLNAGWHHVVNVAIHAGNVLVLFFLLLRLTGAVWRSTAVAALFAIHPLAVESVAWVTQRNTLLSTTFWLLTIWAYARYVERPTRRRYALIGLAFLLAIMSKPIAVTIPITLLFVDWWPLQRFRKNSTWPLIREKIPLLAVAAVGVAVTLMGDSGQMTTTAQLPLQVRIAGAIRAYAEYLLKLIWPHPLGVFYQYSIAVPPHISASLLALTLLTFGIVSARRKAPYALCGWFWYAAVLFPVSGMFQIGGQSIADRFAYLPFVGLYIAIVWGAADCIQRFRIRREIVIAFCVVVASLLSWKSSTQTESWHDSTALYRQALKASGGNEPMHRNLAAELANQGKTTEAVAHYREAIKLDPGRVENYFALGRLLANNGFLDDAATEFREGLRHAPDYLPGRKELGFVYMRLNRLPEASAAFHRVIRDAPNDPDVIPIKALVETLPPPADISDESAPELSVEVARQGPDPSIKPHFIRPDLPWTFGMVLACVLLAILIPTIGTGAFRLAEQALTWLSRKRIASLAAVALLPVTIRLAVLPFHPIPQPIIADEFGYLLIADTFANGRVTNPTPPMWEHFITQYEFFQPTYTAKYPFGEPVFMAAAQVFGLDPWFGVCLGVAMMCMAMYWMLLGWVSPKWALLGGLLVAVRYGITSYWMNSYWGGAIAAAGGALVIGAIPRIKRQPRVRDAVILSVGLLLLANTRPYEGFLLALPVALMLTWWFLRTRTGSMAERFRIVVVPACVVLAAGIGFMLYYNWRVTGNALLMPYKWNQKLYGTPTPFYFQSPLPEPPGLTRYKDLRDNYLWQKENYDVRFSPSKLAQVSGEKLVGVWDFFVQPAMTIPFLFLPFIWRRRELRPVIAAAGFVLVGIGLYPFFFPHYAAPVFAIFALVMVEGLRRTRQLSWRGKPVGAFLCAALILMVACITASESLSPLIEQAKTIRSQAMRRFEAAGGKHLVMIRYKPDHLFHYGWVYNDADIDGSPVVWARDLDAKSNEELFRYYHDRNIWLLEVDEKPARLSRYPGTENKTAGL